MFRKKLFFVWLGLMMVVLACSFGGKKTPEATTSPEQAVTATVALPSVTPAADLPTVTMTPAGCTLGASYVADVTIPDNTQVQPGASFRKVWRLRNSGTCDWEPGTQLGFVSGEAMTTTGVVPVPALAVGGTTDVGVTMIAPSTPGTYKSTWQMISPQGVKFGSRIYAQIVVPAVATAVPPTTAPTSPPPTREPSPTPSMPPLATLIVPVTVVPTIPAIVLPQKAMLDVSSQGQVESTGDVRSGVSNAGDTDANAGLEAFVTFNLSSIPDNATVQSVSIIFPGYDTLGDPFGSLGCMRVYEQNYGSLDAGDYQHPPVLGAVARFCSEADLTNENAQQLSSSTFAHVQGRLTGDDLYQLRFQFNEKETDNDGVADVLRSIPKLVVTYTAP